LLGFKKDEIISVTKKDANVRFAVDPHSLCVVCRVMRMLCVARRVRGRAHIIALACAGLVDR
jgi:hypothetical protein